MQSWSPRIRLGLAGLLPTIMTLDLKRYVLVSARTSLPFFRRVVWPRIGGFFSSIYAVIGRLVLASEERHSSWGSPPKWKIQVVDWPAGHSVPRSRLNTQAFSLSHSLSTTRGVQRFVCLRRSSGHAGSCSIYLHPRAGCLKLEAVADHYRTVSWPGEGDHRGSLQIS